MSEVLAALQATIQGRRDQPRAGSYTCELFAAGRARILQKVGEEAVEVVLAGALADDAQFLYEGADLIYHLLVALAERGLRWEDLEAELQRRFH